MNTSTERLVFIYNARSGALNAILDTAHKVFSPKTYQCRLCELTYGAFSEQKAWKEFRETSKVPFEFLHTDEFEKEYFRHKPKGVTYPIVFSFKENLLTEVVSTQELDDLASLDALMKLVRERSA